MSDTIHDTCHIVLEKEEENEVEWTGKSDFWGSRWSMQLSYNLLLASFIRGDLRALAWAVSGKHWHEPEDQGCIQLLFPMHSHVGAVFSHDSSLPNNIHAQGTELNTPKTACGCCPCDGINNNNNKQSKTITHAVLWPYGNCLPFMFSLRLFGR